MPIVLDYTKLTPANDWKYDQVFHRNSNEDYHQFLEEENSFCRHPHPGDQDEVVEEHTHSNATSSVLSTINTSHKHYQHQDKS